MDGEAALAWCRERPGSVEDFPFGPDARVFKVGGKMFAIFPPQPAPAEVSLKCDPGLAQQLRAEHPGIVPGYHLNKRHWNTVPLDGSLPAGLVEDLLGHSYTVVVDALPRASREALRPTAE